MVDITGVVVERWGDRPVPRALVTVRETGEVATSDDAGRFTLSSVEAGLVHLDGTADEHSPGTVTVNVDGSQLVYPVRLQLRPVVKIL